ncbi:MAG: hypothetical protein NVSMB27_07330 [Ktedonobacteraceae bacterium]
MKYPAFLLTLGLILSILLTACGQSTTTSSSPVTHPTAISPTPPSTPTIGIGVPVRNGEWEVTIQRVHKETKVSCILPGIQTTTYTPKSGFIFLVLDTTFQTMNSTEVAISTKDNTLLSENGTMITPSFLADLTPNGSQPASYCQVGTLSKSQTKVLKLGVAFTVKVASIGQVFKFQFQKLPLISFTFV